MHINRARDNADVQLHAKIASTYMQLGQLRMARIYVSRICHPLCRKDRMGSIIQFDLNLPDDEDTTVFAELMFVGAQISIAAGNEHQAQLELSAANRHDPDREDIIDLKMQCQTREEDRRQRREKTQGLQDRSHVRKYECMFISADIQTQLPG